MRAEPEKNKFTLQLLNSHFPCIKDIPAKVSHYTKLQPEVSLIVICQRMTAGFPNQWESPKITFFMRYKIMDGSITDSKYTDYDLR
jgi:hypothetical protein